MANLIIKPTSGGLLKLQEDGGTDAISIGTDGKSTITEIHGDTKFPVNYPIQIVTDSVTTAANSDTSTSTSLALVERGSNIYDWKQTITGVTSGNWVIVEMMFKFFASRGSSDTVGVGFGVKHSTATDGSGTSTVYEQGADAHYIHLSGSASQTYQLMDTETLMFVHKTPSAGSNTYYLAHKVQSGVSNRIQSSSGTTPFSTKLTEIQK